MTNEIEILEAKKASLLQEIRELQTQFDEEVQSLADFSMRLDKKEQELRYKEQKLDAQGSLTQNDALLNL